MQRRRMTLWAAAWAALSAALRQIFDLERRARQWVERLPGADEEFLA